MFDTYAKAAKEFGVESFGNVEVDDLDDLDDGATDYYPSKVSVNFCRNKNNVDFAKLLLQAVTRRQGTSAAAHIQIHPAKMAQLGLFTFVYVVTSSASRSL